MGDNGLVVLIGARSVFHRDLKARFEVGQSRKHVVQNLVGCRLVAVPRSSNLVPSTFVLREVVAHSS